MVSGTERDKDTGHFQRKESEPLPPAVSDVSSVSQKTRVAKRRLVFLRLVVVGITVAALGGGWLVLNQGREETDDAYVDAHISNISSRVSGTVVKVLVADNQLVTAGQPLVELDSDDYALKVEQAAAGLEAAGHAAFAARDKISASSLSSQGQTVQASADVSAMQAQIDTAHFQIQQADADFKRAEMKVREQEAQVRFAEADFERYKSVYSERVVTKQQFDKAKEAYDIALAQLEQSQNSLQLERDKKKQAESQLAETLERLKKMKGGVTSALATTHQKQVDEEEYARCLADVKKAQANLKQAKLELSYTTVNAPVSGRIGHKSVEVGQRIDAGQLLMAVVQPDTWVSANFKETQVGRMRIGQSVEIKIDSFPGRTFKGSLDSLSPASGAKFSMLPPDNATGNFTKVVQRVPVKILFDEKSIQSIKGNISPGMSCIVSVLTKS